MDNEATRIVRKSYEAYEKKDRSIIEPLLAEDFHFSSPLDNQIDRKTYFERCWPNSQTTQHFEFISMVADGDKVFVTYEARDTKDGKFRNTEVFTLKDKKIKSVEVYFGWDLPHKAPPGKSVDSASFQ